MSELAKEYKIAQFLAKKMTGELSPEEEQELVKLKKESYPFLPSLTIIYLIPKTNVNWINFKANSTRTLPCKRL